MSTFEDNGIIPVTEEDSGFRIHFKELLKIDKDIDLKDFEINLLTQKSFRNRKSDFTEQLNFLFIELKLDTEFIEHYFEYVILMKLNDSLVSSVEKSTKKILLLLKDRINTYVETLEESYHSPKSLEEMDTPAKRELYFSNDHLKRLLKIIIASKFLYPYLNDNRSEIKKKVVDTLWTFQFINTDRNLNMKNKIQKFCFSRILTTIYSDKRFWNMVRLHNISPLSFANVLYVRFVTTNISFVEWDKNPIPFLDVVLNNNIQWLKKRNFTHSFNLIEPDRQEDSIDGLAEKYTSNFTGENRATNFIINQHIYEQLEVKLKPYFAQGDFYKNLLKKINDNIRRNITYNYILFPYLSKVFKVSTERLLLVDKRTLSMLIVYTIIELEKHNLAIISSLLTSNVTTSRLSIDSKKADSYKNIAGLLDDERYIDLLETKFSHLKDVVVEQRSILKIVATIYYNKFVPFGSDEELKFTAEEIIDELLKFYQVVL